MKLNRYLALGISAGALLCTSAGHAGEASGASDSATLEEVVVTAERREETVQNTPLAIAVIDPEELSRRGVKDFTNIDKLAPDVSVTRIVGSYSINIRGIQSGATSPTTETPNAVHIDGAYIDRPSGLDGMFYDVRRVEVLKGPQGTLYGRNTPAGAVNIITNDPATGKFEGSGTLELGSYSQVRAEAALNMPVSDRFALRLAARHYKHDGYYESGFEDADQQSVRLKGLWTISDTTRLLLSLDYQKIGQSATPGTNIVGYTANTVGTAPVPADSFDDRAIFGSVASKYHFNVDNTGYMAQLDKELSFANLTIQASHRELEIDQMTTGISAVSVAGSPPALPVPAVGIPTLFYNPVESKWSTLEARLASNQQSSLQWVAGLFVFDSSTVWTATNYQPATAFPAGPPFFTLGGPLHEARSYAAFGQATWTTGEKLHLTAGLRYNNDEKEAYTTQGFFGGPPVRYPAVGTDKGKWNKVTGTARIAYDITPANMIYASVSTGYQAGGFGYGSTPKFEPEENTAYEFGSKNRFLDNRLQLNAELYYYDDKNRVANVFRVLNPGTAQQQLDLSLINAGLFEYKGGSLDLQWAATAVDRVRFGLAYSDGKYKKYVIPAPIITILDGEPQNGPKWTGRADYAHTFHLAQGSLELNVSGQYRGSALLINITPGCVASPTNQSVCNSALPNNGNVASRVPQKIYEGAYWLGDISLQYVAPSERWSLMGYVNNAFDTDAFVTKALQSPSSNFIPHVGLVTGTKPLPRTYGAIVSVHF